MSGFCPQVLPVHAKKGKLLRAEPIAGQFREDRVRLVGALPKLEWEWMTWMPGGDSPGRIDASVYLAYSLLPVPGSESVIGSPLRTPRRQTTAASRYSRTVASK